MSNNDRQFIGDGSDNYIGGAKSGAEAAKQFGRAAASKAGGAASNAAAASIKAGASSGKAASGAAIGAAAGGAWGAIIASAWAMRHTLFKLLVIIGLCLLFLIVMVVSLPSIVFNSIFKTDPETVPASGPTEMHEVYEVMSAVVSGCVQGGYDYALADVERIISEGGYDYELSTQATVNHGFVSADYDVCYIFAAYSASMEQRGTTKENMKKKLDAVMHLMFPVTYEVLETTVTVPGENEEDEPVTKTVKYVRCTIHPFDASVILDAFGLDPDAPYSQFGIRTGDAIDSMALALRRTLYGLTATGQVPPITDAELTEFLNSLSCSPARKEIIKVGLSLVGRVPYFWGGKSSAGWNEAWNTPRLVTAAGSSSTGTIRPFGLDCSGFTDWAYKTALGTSLPGGSANQWSGSTEITKAELLPGDLGFKDRPGAVPINHVLIYAGKDKSGNLLWVHSTASAGGVVLDSPSYIKYYRRVNGIDLENMTVPN